MKTAIKAPAFLKKAYRASSPEHVRLRKTIDFLDSRTFSLEETQSFISGRISAGGSTLIARPGGTESEALDQFLRNRVRSSSVSVLRPYSRFLRSRALANSGIIARTDVEFDEFAMEYLKSTLAASLLAYGAFAPGALGLVLARERTGEKNTNFLNLEPLEALSSGIRPWTDSLAGKKVLLVHPFVNSIRAQHEKIQSAKVEWFLPAFELIVVSPPRTVTTTSAEATTWLTELKRVEEEIEMHDFDVAILGAGSYGLPLAHFVARQNRVAIHLGGTTQLLFGISGKRWANHPWTTDHFRDTWVSPMQRDLFPGVTGIEGGSYH